MTLTGKLADLTLDFRGGGQTLSFTINEDFKPYFDELKGRELTVEVDTYKKKRSLSANAYCWVLINKIAGALQTTKEEVYVTMLSRYGQCEVISVKSGIDISPCVKYFEQIGESELNGKKFTHYKIYAGSSEYNTEQMAQFLDGVISEAKEMGISTETPQEIQRLKELWR